MSKTAFTPGPWAAFYKHKYDEWHVAVPMSGSTMRRALFPEGIRTENPEADARLIAAAPALYEACQTLMELPASEEWLDTLQKAVRQAKAALALVERAEELQRQRREEEK